MAGNSKTTGTTADGRVNRRVFMGQAAAVTAALGAGLSAGPKRARAETPRRGGVFRQGLAGGSTSDTLDPALLATTLVCNVNFQLRNCLVEVTPESTAAPELAESFEASEDGRRWIFKLRRGVQFHNGKEMTAADVIHSLNRHRGPDTVSATAQMMKVVEDITTSGPDEVTVHLTEPYFDLPYLLADYHMTIVPEGDDGNSGMGTGPYALKEGRSGERYFAERNPNYFRSDQAWFDAIETLAINDGAARTAALQTGDVDIINGIEPRAVSLMRRNADIEVVNTNGRNFFYFPMHCDKAPFDNADLRLALKYATDREELVRVILFGFGSVGNDHPVSSAYPLAPDIPQRQFDVDKAAFHYKKSGHSGPVTLKISDAAFPGGVDAALLMQQSMAKAGIELDVQRVPADGYWERIWLVEPFCGSQWSGRPTQDLILSAAFLSEAPWNDSKWKRPEFDSLLVAARSERDEAKRRQIYHEAVTMVHEDAGHLNPMFNDYLDGMSKRVKGFVRDPNFEMSGYKAAARCWFAD